VALAVLPTEAFQFNGQTDYNMVIPQLLAKYYPPGLLGLGLTALLASFMSAWPATSPRSTRSGTYDIYEPYIKGDGHRRALHEDRRQATVFGTVASVATGVCGDELGNINDLLQLVFSFINAPLFATFLLGMFWARTTANGAFWGLLSGIIACALHYLLTSVGGGAQRRVPHVLQRHGP